MTTTNTGTMNTNALFSLLIVTVILVCELANATPVHARVLSTEDIKNARQAFEAIDKKRPKTAKARIGAVSHPVLRKALYWSLYVNLPAAVEWPEISRFIARNPSWPRIKTLRKNVEERMRLGQQMPEALAWFEKMPPVTTKGRIFLVGDMFAQGRDDEAIALVRALWVDGTFSRADEKWFYRTYRKHLTGDDHWKRLDRLLWEGANWPVRRMFWRVNDDLRKLAEARYLLRHMRGNVDSAIAKVPRELRNDPGLVYERLRWRRRRGKDESAWLLLGDLPAYRSHAGLWFGEREILARRALNAGFVSRAYNLVSEHTVDPSEAAPYSSAEWMSGWIALRFLGEPARALGHFSDMYEAVHFPVSLARAAYWAGRSARALGDNTLADTWFRRAAAYPTTYYGQLAWSMTGAGSGAPLPLPVPAYLHAINPVGAEFDNHELVQAVKLLNELGEQARMRPFFVHLKDLYDKDTEWLTAIGNLAVSSDRYDMAIHVGERAGRTGTFLPHLGYPVIDLPPRPGKAKGTSAEKALVYALIRQESAYFEAARSAAGARGLMQIMPATAKSTARSVGLPYERARLTTDPEYNLKLGQSYLSEVLDRFDGSYVLGLAAYNAGPHRARAWIKAHGDPRDPDVDVIDWIELIPFSETRNYVQRVLENVQVYRALISDVEVALNLNDDLLR